MAIGPSQELLQRRRGPGTRLLGAAVLGVAFAVASALMLVERSSRLFHLPAKISARTPLPTPDFTSGELHFIGWAILGLLAMVVVRRGIRRVGVLTAMALAGVGFEVAQHLFTITRDFQRNDVWMNVYGLLTGAALGVVFTTGARVVRRSYIP